MPKLLLILSILLLLNDAVLSQKEVAHQNCAWYMYFGNHRISERIGLHTEYQWRRYTLIDYWQQSLLRVGLDYYTKSGPIITAGYGWIRSFPYGEQPIAYPFNEHRIWQQLILTQTSGRFNFHHRYRLEQRFLERKTQDIDGVWNSDEYVFRQRARYRFFVAIPLSHKSMEDNTLFLSVYDEVFLGFGGGIGKNILDQNRLYAALGWKFNKNVNTQVGYLLHMIFKSDGIHIEQNNTLQVSLQYNFDFRDKN